MSNDAKQLIEYQGELMISVSVAACSNASNVTEFNKMLNTHLTKQLNRVTSEVDGGISVAMTFKEFIPVTSNYEYIVSLNGKKVEDPNEKQCVRIILDRLPHLKNNLLMVVSSRSSPNMVCGIKYANQAEMFSIIRELTGYEITLHNNYYTKMITFEAPIE